MLLHSYPGGRRVNKILIAAKYVGTKVDVTPKFEFGVDNRTPEFLAKNPLGKVPVLDTPEGPLFESSAIARYIARSGKNNLYGTNAYEAGQVEQWLEFFNNELELPFMAWMYPIDGYIPNNPQATAKAQQDVKKVLGILDQHLLTRTYLVGNSISLADIVLGTTLSDLYSRVLDSEFRKPYVNTNRWILTIVNQPFWKEVAGEFKFCEKMAVAAAPAKAEKKEKAPKEPKKEAPKKEAPKKEAPKKEAADDEEKEESYEDDEPKGKNPLDALPKSSFVLDEWKRVYSNKDTRAEALPWFFQNLDKAGYSLFWCDYKYNQELSKVFMTSNLIGGFFQRLEKLHKYAFGSMLILGNEPNLSVHGVWLFRGPEIPAEMKACDDAEHYNWSPVNLDDAKQKKLLEDMFAWESSDNFGGKGPYGAGKVFK